MATMMRPCVEFESSKQGHRVGQDRGAAGRKAKASLYGSAAQDGSRMCFLCRSGP